MERIYEEGLYMDPKEMEHAIVELQRDKIERDAIDRYQAELRRQAEEDRRMRCNYALTLFAAVSAIASIASAVFIYLKQ